VRIAESAVEKEGSSAGGVRFPPTDLCATLTHQEREVPMGLLGSSFEEKVRAALDAVRALGLGVADLDARVEGKVVTLLGTAPTMEVKAKVMQEFNARVETDNTLNQVRLARPEPAGPSQPAAGPEERWHVVASGDTLSALAKRYYGRASLYMKIFEANKDQLSNPDLIKVGQKLRIPT
jgi:phage tail protein X